MTPVPARNARGVASPGQYWGVKRQRTPGKGGPRRLRSKPEGGRMAPGGQGRALGLFILGLPVPAHPSAATRRDDLRHPLVEGPGSSSGVQSRPEEAQTATIRNGKSTLNLSQNGYGFEHVLVNGQMKRMETQQMDKKRVQPNASV